jgi:DNA-binding NarL/FixJ family response regulator
VRVVTTFENDEYVYEALRAGASGFLLKRARPAEIAEAIRVVARGESLLFPEALRRLVAAKPKYSGSCAPGCRTPRSRRNSWPARRPSKRMSATCWPS